MNFIKLQALHARTFGFNEIHQQVARQISKLLVWRLAILPRC